MSSNDIIAWWLLKGEALASLFLSARAEACKRADDHCSAEDGDAETGWGVAAVEAVEAREPGWSRPGEVVWVALERMLDDGV